VYIGLFCVSSYGAYLNLYRALLVLLSERIWGSLVCLVKRVASVYRALLSVYRALWYKCIRGSFECI